MVILRTRNKITDFLMILAWASPFKCSPKRHKVPYSSLGFHDDETLPWLQWHACRKKDTQSGTRREVPLVQVVLHERKQTSLAPGGSGLASACRGLITLISAFCAPSGRHTMPSVRVVTHNNLDQLELMDFELVDGNSRTVPTVLRKNKMESYAWSFIIILYNNNASY